MMIDWVRVVIAVLALVAAATLGGIIYYDWMILKRAGINGQVRHVTIELIRTVALRLVAASLILASAFIQADRLFMVAVCSVLFIESLSDMRGRFIALKLANISQARERALAKAAAKPEG